MTDLTFLSNADPAALEQLYQQYRADRTSVDRSWQQFFAGFEFAQAASHNGTLPVPFAFSKESNVLNLISGYRTRGHLFTKTNPVRTRRQYDDPLTLESFGLDESDLDRVFQAGSAVGLGPAKLRDIVALLEETYCHSVAVEYRYVRDPRVVNWLQSRMESSRNRRPFTNEERHHLLWHLTQTVVFEKFMHSRFVGQKRFSIEGVEAIIPALDAVVEKGSEMGIEEYVIGLAHRGRLSILANILDKRYEHIFAEFEGKSSADEHFAGDVKYHVGHTCEKLTHTGRKVRVSVAPNPSHLEAADPVVEGLVRSRLDHVYGGDLNKIAAILVHGDSSIAGQGVVYEVAQMSQLDGYRTGGTVHIVLNNQVGFTTNYLDARSSTYCTDVAKVTLSPVFHVNCDDAEAVVYVIELALEFRQEFKRDVFIDILGYRKWGHNEGDEPRFTQPVLYKAIAAHPNPMEIYRRKLLELGVLDEAQARKVEDEFRSYLEERYEISKSVHHVPLPSFMPDVWRDFSVAEPDDFRQSPFTGTDRAILDESVARLTALPSGPKWFPKIEKIFADRRRLYFEAGRVDWATAELLAYATLLREGHPVRVSGQDAERGTFAHRHAVVKIEDSEEEYVPLAHVADGQARFAIYNSPLSEYGVLGFEYGYALGTPNGLTVWEAQFGDFANVAQPIIDQFVAPGETKWRQMNGLVLLLPHGFEGQGPEHSSARLERFLLLCADLNMQVVNCTTPAQFFHVLRRQLHRPFRKPLVIMTPKSLLRHPECVSPVEELITGTRFHEILDDDSVTPARVTRVVFCSGKVYFDLLERRRRDARDDVAIVRVEQIYPLPETQLSAIVEKYSAAREWLWVQEEPENVGAWLYVSYHFAVPGLKGIFRPASSTTATGFPEQHALEQQRILDEAFA